MGAQGTLYDCADGTKSTWTCQATMDGFGDSKSPIKVFATDYDNYDVGYGCSNWLFGLWKSENISVRSRKYTLSADKI